MTHRTRAHVSGMAEMAASIHTRRVAIWLLECLDLLEKHEFPEANGKFSKLCPECFGLLMCGGPTEGRHKAGCKWKAAMAETEPEIRNVLAGEGEQL